MRVRDGDAVAGPIDQLHVVLAVAERNRAFAREAQVLREEREAARLRHLGARELEAWLTEPPTKLVAVGEPHQLDAFEVQAKQHFDGRLFISKSLPFFLEFASPSVTKGSGLAFVAEHLGFSPEATVAFGDGENDVELLAWAGYGVAVANGHRRVLELADLVCPPVEEEGVAQVIEAFLHSRP